MHISASTKHTIATGVAFPVAEDAMEQLQAIKEGTITYVQLVSASGNSIGRHLGCVLPSFSLSGPITFLTLLFGHPFLSTLLCKGARFI